MWMWVCSLGFVVLFWQHLHNRIQDKVGRVSLSQTVGGKDPPKDNPTITKTQLQRTHISGIKGIPRKQVQEIKETTPLNPTGLLS